MVKQPIFKIIQIFIAFYVLLSMNACHQSVIPDISNGDNEDSEFNTIKIYSYVVVKSEQNIVKDCTPEINIFTEKENVVYMSFSGNGSDWSEWVDYSESYSNFNIASGLFGTTMTSGVKSVYVQFKDSDEIIFPLENQEPVFCTFEYQMQDLFSIKIDPYEAQVKVGGSYSFIIRGYDIKLNEVPLEPTKVEWTKNCGVGELNPTFGLQTKYTAPQLPGIRNISAHYGSLSTGAKIYISSVNQ